MPLRHWQGSLNIAGKAGLAIRLILAGNRGSMFRTVAGRVNPLGNMDNGDEAKIQ